MSPRASLLLAVALAAVPAGASAAGLQILRRTLSARAASMADAFTAVPGGLDSLEANPAGLTASTRTEVGTSFASGVLDDTFGFLGAARPLPLGVMAAGVSYYDAGKVDLHFTGGGTSVRTAQRDFVGHFAWAVPLPGGLSAGATLKPWRSELAQEAKASGMAADFGAQWKTPVPGLVLGASYANAGSGVRYEQETEQLPSAARGGASWSWTGAPAKEIESSIASSRALVSAEAIKERDLKTAAALGAEVGLRFFSDAEAAVRAGWTLNSDAARLNVGVGLREGRWALDYALDEKRTLGATHHVGFGVKF